MSFHVCFTTLVWIPWGLLPLCPLFGSQSYYQSTGTSTNRLTYEDKVTPRVRLRVGLRVHIRRKGDIPEVYTYNGASMKVQNDQT